MLRPTLTFRCASRSDRDELHTITVENQTVLCSCIGTEWCSHIEATLIYGERHMVPFEEWDTVDQAQSFLSGLLRAPSHWKAHWLEDKIWRGLAQPRQTAMDRALRSRSPTICFIGCGNLGTRHDYAVEAEHLGWTVIDTPTKLVTLAVCSEQAFTSKRARSAIDLDIPFLSYADWEAHAFDFTEQILDRIEEHDRRLSEPPERIAA